MTDTTEIQRILGNILKTLLKYIGKTKEMDKFVDIHDTSRRSRNKPKQVRPSDP
jgi:hypothetical protein